MENRLKGLLAVLLISVAIWSVTPAIKAQPPSAPAIWIEPAALNFNTTTTEIGDEFNVTVWASATSDVFAYQVNVTYDPTMLNVTSVSYTGSFTSAWFAGHTTVPIPPSVNYAEGDIVLGETLLGRDVIHASSGSICYITFVIIAAPSLSNTFASFIDTSQPDGSSYLLDPDLTSMPDVTLGYATYVFSNSGAPPPPVRHYVVVSSMSAPSQWNQGDPMWISVTVLNKGTLRETFKVNATCDSALIGEQTVASLAAGATRELNFIWDTTDFAVGNYTITATATPVLGQTDLSNISKTMSVQLILYQPPPPPQQAYVARVAWTLTTLQPTVFTGPPVVQSTSIGQNFTVNLYVSNASGLNTWQASLTFDPKILKCTGVYTNGTASSGFVNNTLGTVSNIGGSVNGGEQLAYLTFTSVGIGVSDFQLTSVSLWDSSAKPIPYQTKESFTVPVNGTNYGVEIVWHLMNADNFTTVPNGTKTPPSGVLNTTFNAENKEINFEALATSDWSCQVSIPKELLSSDSLSEWTVVVDGTPVTYKATENNTFTTLYFTNDKGNHRVEIIGTDVIGENPQNLAPSPLLIAAVASICLTTLVAALVDLKKTRSFRMSDKFIHNLSRQPPFPFFGVVRALFLHVAQRLGQF